MGLLAARHPGRGGASPSSTSFSRFAMLLGLTVHRELLREGWVYDVMDVMMYTVCRGNQETKKFCSGKAMNLGCLQPPRKQEVPSRPMLLGVTASPESSMDGNHLGTLQDPTSGYLSLYICIYSHTIIYIYIYSTYRLLRRFRHSQHLWRYKCQQNSLSW